jgi:hypothetical protein
VRIRTIKPEFFLHEDLFDLEEETHLPIRVAFAGLWCAADREGRFHWKIRRLKSQILPYDDVDFSRVLHALTTRGLIVKYASGDDQYGWIPNFTKHQMINNREKDSELPEPPESAQEVIPTRAARVPDASLTPLEHAQAEGKGREQGKECVSKGKSGRKKFKPPSLDEWTDYGKTLDPPFEPVAAASAWNHYEANGWKVGRNPMKDWKAACRSCHSRWLEQAPVRRTSSTGPAKASASATAGNGGKAPSTWEIKTKLEAVEQRIRELKSRSPGEHCSLRDFLSDDEWTEYQDLHRSRDSLRKSLTKIA